MSIKIIPKERQGTGQFNAGAILENKPIGFPQDGGESKAYSNLFYWAHAWTPGSESLIGEHPHQGFEIMSFVLKGSLVHYDSKNKEWRSLNEGDAQIIRSGKGITHAEKVGETSEFFQIWLDPGLDKTMELEASYDDYSADLFPVTVKDGISTKIYKGEGAPMEMDTPGIQIKELTISPGKYDYALESGKVYSTYLISGSIKLEGTKLAENDFTIIQDMDKINIEALKESKWFMIESPKKLDYLTYVEKFKSHF